MNERSSGVWEHQRAENAKPVLDRQHLVYSCMMKTRTIVQARNIIYSSMLLVVRSRVSEDVFTALSPFEICCCCRAVPSNFACLRGYLVVPSSKRGYTPRSGKKERRILFPPLTTPVTKRGKLVAALYSRIVRRLFDHSPSFVFSPCLLFANDVPF